ncbi:hypothetical protein EHRUM1_08730 [Ehrlichia ruminantium]|nr:hypothetical protein EHRUM1_08730 [Ehrlichia ruminantium]
MLHINTVKSWISHLRNYIDDNQHIYSNTIFTGITSLAYYLIKTLSILIINNNKTH